MSREKYKMSIGLEVHAQINTEKLFSVTSGDLDMPNSNVANFDIAIPGTLPRMNSTAVKKAIDTGLLTNCEIQNYSRFDRKHYFYPDLPFGFQISQFFYPIAKNGFIQLDSGKIAIERIHMETDAGKMIHEPEYSILDFNRLGVGLMEIVTGPDIHSAEEAKAFVEQLILHLKYANSCDCNMEDGNLRFDVNISLSKNEKLGERVEIKNLNSIKFMIQAIEIESNRQIDILESGGVVYQETRGFDADRKETFFMRSKEDAIDYRYMPDGNIPPIVLKTEDIELQRSKLPESPNVRRKNLLDLGVGHEQADFLVNRIDWFDFFKEIIPISKNISQIANFITSDLINLTGDDVKKIRGEYLSFISNTQTNGDISMKNAKFLLEECIKTERNPREIMEEHNLLIIKDIDKIKGLVEEVLRENPQEVLRYKSGKTNLLQFFLGQIIRKTSGRVDPDSTKDILLSCLS